MELTNKERKKLRVWSKKFFPDDKDSKTFDIAAEIDSNISFVENQTIIREKIRNFINEYNNKDLLKRSEAELMPEKQYKFLVEEQLEKVEQQAELEFNKTLEEIENKTTTNFLEEIYYIPKQFAKMVANGNAKGFLIYGEAGLGKTYSVIRAFREAKKKFTILSGHITSLEFYNFLFEHREENIILDDVNIFQNQQNLNMLKAGLSDNSRIVQYHTTSNKLRVPNKFLFNGTITILLNKIPKETENLRAVESRILTYELKLDYKTKIKVLFELARQKYKKLTQEERTEIVNWIKENTSPATENLNLRLLFTIYEIFRFDKENWKKLAEKIVKDDWELYLICVQGLNCKDWCEKTGLSRATYYRNRESVSNSHDSGIYQNTE